MNKIIIKEKPHECSYMLLVKLPTGKIHKVVIGQGSLIEAVINRGDFHVLETPLEFDFKT